MRDREREEGRECGIPNLLQNGNELLAVYNSCQPCKIPRKMLVFMLTIIENQPYFLHLG